MESSPRNISDASRDLLYVSSSGTLVDGLPAGCKFVRFGERWVPLVLQAFKFYMFCWSSMSCFARRVCPDVPSFKRSCTTSYQLHYSDCCLATDTHEHNTHTHVRSSFVANTFIRATHVVCCVCHVRDCVHFDYICCLQSRWSSWFPSRGGAFLQSSVGAISI